ncbi:MAG: hypothetical protein ACI837_000517, partial [Crocinitomicaceae bacterium]
LDEAYFMDEIFPKDLNPLYLQESLSPEILVVPVDESKREKRKRKRKKCKNDRLS